VPAIDQPRRLNKTAVVPQAGTSFVNVDKLRASGRLGGRGGGNDRDSHATPRQSASVGETDDAGEEEEEEEARSLEEVCLVGLCAGVGLCAVLPSQGDALHARTGAAAAAY
jgi:hypothetical protein